MLQFFFLIFVYIFMCLCNYINSYSVDNLYNELFIKNCLNFVFKVYFSFV